MNGKQIEELALLIQKNINEIDEEAAAYIESHLPQLAADLKRTGFAVIKTSAGDLRLDIADLERSAA